MAKRGRKNVYDTKIKPRFKEIAEWCQKGATERSIANKLGVHYSTFNKYKAEKKEFTELLKKNKACAVDDIENAMYKSAIGGIQTLKKAIKCKHIEYKEGKRIREYETIEYYDEDVYIPPNTTAGIYLLKHWGKDRGYTNDPQTLALRYEELKQKKKEFEYKKEREESQIW